MVLGAPTYPYVGGIAVSVVALLIVIGQYWWKQYFRKNADTLHRRLLRWMTGLTAIAFTMHLVMNWVMVADPVSFHFFTRTDAQVVISLRWFFYIGLWSVYTYMLAIFLMVSWSARTFSLVGTVAISVLMGFATRSTGAEIIAWSVGALLLAISIVMALSLDNHATTYRVWLIISLIVAWLAYGTVWILGPAVAKVASLTVESWLLFVLDTTVVVLLLIFLLFEAMHREALIHVMEILGGTVLAQAPMPTQESTSESSSSKLAALRSRA